MSVYENSKRKAFLFYDTEQSKVQTYKNITNLLRRCGRETMPEYLKAYCLTVMSRKERLQAIIQSMDKFYYQFRGIHMLVIDGIADLIKGANDETESIAVVEELYRLAGVYNTCIVTILHKTYYREKDVHEFIRRYFDGENVGKDKPEEDAEDERTKNAGMLSDNEDEATEDI